MNQNEPTDTDGKENSVQAMDSAKLKEKPDADQSIPDPGSTPIVTSPPEKEQVQMEVHHHPQLVHSPKPWKEYLLEGFMIFIAVTLGFIAENIREMISDREHVRQLTTQLVQDLRADTAQLNRIYNGESTVLRTTDTLFALLQKPIQKTDLKKVQKLTVGSHNLWLFQPSTGAMAAIKNDLRLKPFSNSKIIAYIANYEGHSSLTHTVERIALEYQRAFIDPFMRLHFTPANLDAAFNHLPVDSTMRNLTQQDLTQLATDLVLVRINIKEMIRDNRQLEIDGSELLTYVVDRYHPKQE
jgi:hypothetical protein